MISHSSPSRSALMCFMGFSAGEHPLLGVDEEGLNITQVLIRLRGGVQRDTWKRRSPCLMFRSTPWAGCMSATVT